MDSETGWALNCMEEGRSLLQHDHFCSVQRRIIEATRSIRPSDIDTGEAAPTRLPSAAPTGTVAVCQRL